MSQGPVRVTEGLTVAQGMILMTTVSPAGYAALGMFATTGLKPGA
jgi:hypothetical protein